MKKIIATIFLTFLVIVSISAQERSIADYKFEIVEDILLSEHEIFRPNLIDAYKDEKIVFFDFTRSKLVIYDIDNNSFSLLGNKGRGPKEFGQIFDLKVDNDGEIYLIDTGNYKMVKWGVNGDYLGEMSVGSRFVKPARFALCKNSDLMYILSSQYGRKGLLHLYDKDGTLKKSFHKIANKEERFVYYTDGSLTCGEQNNLYYVKLYINEIMKFNPKGQIEYELPVYNSEPNEELIITKGNFITLNPEARRYSGDVYYLNNKLFVSYLGLPQNFRFRYIDVYSENKQEYLHSIQLPYEFREFAITDDKIVTIREDEDGEMYLTVFKYVQKG
jgi:hypothetical protein